MIQDLEIYENIRESGIDLILSLPCVLLKGLLKVIEEKNEIQHVPVTREEEGVGIAAGAYLGGRTPAILMQNSGMGNSINAVKSLLQLFNIPIIFIMSHRGTKEEKIIAQIPMGKLIPKLLNLLGIKAYYVDSMEKIKEIQNAMQFSRQTKKSTAILLQRSLWGV